MGMFDSVNAKCPECGGNIEFQSKSGECILRNFPITEVPLEIAADIDGEYGHCDQCHDHFQIKSPGVPGTVPMILC